MLSQWLVRWPTYNPSRTTVLQCCHVIYYLAKMARSCGYTQALMGVGGVIDDTRKCAEAYHQGGDEAAAPFRRYTLLMGRVPLHQEVNPINAEVWLAWELGVEIGQPYTSQDFAEYLLSLPWVVVNHRGLKSIALRAFAWFWEGREWYRRNTNMHVGCGLREWHSTLLDSPLNTRGSKAVSAIYHQVRDYVAKGN